ncbi:hypothetical protein AB0D13_36445 [Streptomyces sp. NPDC048430]|uniref:hypothetical protein n=1 Tax=Streptomyces sp. NPDC048430 TaxID=3155388 RepID=UPI0034261502
MDRTHGEPSGLLWLERSVRRLRVGGAARPGSIEMRARTVGVQLVQPAHGIPQGFYLGLPLERLLHVEAEPDERPGSRHEQEEQRDPGVGGEPVQQPIDQPPDNGNADQDLADGVSLFTLA